MREQIASEEREVESCCLRARQGRDSLESSSDQ